ncbi:MAG: hypothetical protein ABTD50_20770 [Polyangiaceae bacterium]|jgi:hypothetical protein
MIHHRVVILLALLLAEAALPLACAPELLAPATPSRAAPAVGVAESQPASAAVPEASAPTVASASSEPEPVASASASAQPTPSNAAEPDPPCIDGDIIMGACICDQGKTADATGHCILVPCPTTAAGRVPFRDPVTGQCMECRSGFKPTKDGKCEP